jgi:uncharacterized membrane protein
MIEDEKRREGEAEMKETSEQTVSSSPLFSLPSLAALIALGGLADAIYLTIHHYSGEQVPCGLTGGCEMVLSSSYASIAGIPLSIFGAAAYFVAFSLALLAAFGNRLMWKIFGVQVTLMAIFSVWLIYLQAFVISNSQVPLVERFCQFCLLSALITFTLFVIALISKFRRSR